MHPLDIIESDRWNEAVEGLEPPATLQQHARSALDLLDSWLRKSRAGSQVRTRCGHVRVLPRSVRLLARQYVNDRFHPKQDWTAHRQRTLRQHYVYALEIAIGKRLETISDRVSHSNVIVRNHARRWNPVIQQLALEAAA